MDQATVATNQTPAFYAYGPCWSGGNTQNSHVEEANICKSSRRRMLAGNENILLLDPVYLV